MKFKPYGFAVALGATLACAGPLWAETLADAMAKAYNYHPALAIQRANMRALDEQEFQARAQAYGSANIAGSYGYQNADVPRTSALGPGAGRNDSDPFTLGLNGSIPIYSGGQIENSSEAALEAVRSGRADYINTEQNVLLDAVTAYEDVRRDIALVGVARSNVRVIGEQLRAARDRFEVGEVTRTDVSQAEARLAASRQALASATGALARSRQAYLAAVGEPAVDLADPPPLPQLPQSEEAAVALAEAQHPRIVAARHDVRQAESNVRVAQGALLPQVSLNGQAGYSDTSSFIDGGTPSADANSYSVTVEASVPLWSGGRNASGIREAQAFLSQSQANVHEVARQLRQQVSDAWSSLDVARISITAAREQIRAAQIAFEGVREEATLGSRTTLDVLNAEQEVSAAKAELIASLRDEYVAGYALLAAVGSLTVQHLGLDVTRYDANAYRADIQNNRYDVMAEPKVEWTSDYRP